MTCPPKRPLLPLTRLMRGIMTQALPLITMPRLAKLGGLPVKLVAALHATGASSGLDHEHHLKYYTECCQGFIGKAYFCAMNTAGCILRALMLGMIMPGLFWQCSEDKKSSKRVRRTQPHQTPSKTERESASRGTSDLRVHRQTPPVRMGARRHPGTLETYRDSTYRGVYSNPHHRYIPIPYRSYRNEPLRTRRDPLFPGYNPPSRPKPSYRPRLRFR